MAAHLDLTRLRRHALPARFLADLDGEAGHPAEPRPAHGTGARPRLRATWHLGAGERPVCTWSVDTDDPA